VPNGQGRAGASWANVAAGWCWEIAKNALAGICGRLTREGIKAMPWLRVVSDAEWLALTETVGRIDLNLRRLTRLDTKIDQLLGGQETLQAGQAKLQQRSKQMALDLTAANAEIARNTDLVSSIKAYAAAMTAKIEELKNATSDPAAQAAIDALVAQLKANDDEATAAVVQNTDAAPAA
jgi:outer membrane murein-binding lipoprotein Lpp